MKRLFEVDIKVYVMAEDANEAVIIGTRECQETEAEAYEPLGVDVQWWDALPYNGDNDRTCGEIIRSQKVALKRGE